ncbi:MAG: DsrE family protein [Desulfarculaceae bacterium]|jgi:hypothetical protein
MPPQEQKAPARLAVIWSSGDREVALSNVFMYTRNGKLKGWWDEVRLVVWGPSARLLCEDQELQDKFASLAQDGVELLACKACADMFEATPKLERLGCKVIYMGQPLTEMLKSGWQVLTY